MESNIPKIIGVAVVVPRGEDVLLIRNRKRGESVEIPCGKREAGESLEDAARRELLEEAGVHALELEFLQVKEMGHYCVHLFRAAAAPDAVPVPGDDASAAWFGAPSLLLTGSHPEDYEFVCRVLATARG